MIPGGPVEPYLTCATTKTYFDEKRPLFTGDLLPALYNCIAKHCNCAAGEGSGMT